MGDTEACNQKNVLRWERVNPPWVLPNYFSELAQALKDMKAWITTGGMAASVPMATGVTAPPNHASDGESKFGMSDVELLTPQNLLSKVRRADKVEHMLNKGLWAVTPATHRGWQIFIDVGSALSFLRYRLILEHRVSWWSVICGASAAKHWFINVMGWPRKFVAGASGTRKHAKTWSLRVSPLIRSL